MAENNPIAQHLPFAYRQTKPRQRGLNYIRAPAVLGSLLEDTVDAYAPHIDILKLSGHQASLTGEATLRRAIATCERAGIKVSVGNPPIDAALTGGRDRLDRVLGVLAEWDVGLVEISGIARAIDEEDLAAAISLAKSHGLDVIFEIGVDYAHSRSSNQELFLARRAHLAASALAAGASYVLIESEGLTENRGGEPPRWDAIDEIVNGLDPATIVFEADDQDVLCRMIDIYGPKTNLMVDYTKIEKLEAARLGFAPSQSIWGKVVSVGPGS